MNATRFIEAAASARIIARMLREDADRTSDVHYAAALRRSADRQDAEAEQYSRYATLAVEAEQTDNDDERAAHVARVEANLDHFRSL